MAPAVIAIAITADTTSRTRPGEAAKFLARKGANVNLHQPF